MAESVLNNADNCLICNEYLSSCRNHLSRLTGYSEKPLYSLIECFVGESLTEDVLSDGGVCQGCMIKFNEYDHYATRAAQLKNELINQFQSSQDASRLDEYHCDLQTTEDFTQFDFDINDETHIEETSAKMTSDEVSEEFQKIIVKEGLKYDIEIFQRTFGDDETAETEKAIKKAKLSSHSKKLNVSLTCDFCGIKGFGNRRNFISHLKSHKKSQFYCEKCQVSFKAANSLKVHLSSDHGNITKNIPCAFSGCSKLFANKTALRAHFVCHNKSEKNPTFVCDTCGKSFHYKLSFTQHLKIHTGIRDQQCEVCGFKAISSTHLKRHIRARHTKEKNHICSYCERAFSERYNMMSHMRKQHLNNESASNLLTFFKCIVCCMEYSDDFKLKKHLELSHNIVEVVNDNFI